MADTTIIDVALAALTLITLAAIAVAWTWRRLRQRQAPALAMAGNATLPLSLEQEQEIRTRIAHLERRTGAPAMQEQRTASALTDLLDAPVAAQSHAGPGLVEPARWLPLVNGYPDEFPHLFIYGPSGSRKTTVAQHIVAARSGPVAILDPKWRPGKWGGAPTATIDDDGEFAPLDTAAAVLLGEFKARLRRLKAGEDVGDEITVVIDEAPDVLSECPTVVALFRRLMRVGRELRMRLIILSTSKSVEELELKGRGDLRDSLTPLRLGRAALALRPDLAASASPAIIEVRGQTVALDIASLSASIPALSLTRHWMPLTEPVRQPIAPVKAPDLTVLANQFAAGSPDTDAVNSGTAQLAPAELVRLLASQRDELGRWRYSANKIEAFVGGTRADVQAQVRRVRAPEDIEVMAEGATSGR